MPDEANIGRTDGDLPLSVDDVAQAIRESFISPNTLDFNMEEANIVDVVHALSENANRIATAITWGGVSKDATGGGVGCLTDAAMGITAALVRIADSITDLACAVRERGWNE